VISTTTKIHDKIKRKENMRNYLYILPAVSLVFLFFICSIIYTLVLSFTDWSGVGSFHFIGFANYLNLFKDPNFRTSLINTLIWVASSLIIPFLIPLLLAIAIVNSSYATLFKNLLYFPNAISGTIVGLIMATMLSVSGLPHLLGVIGFKNLETNWLSIPYTNTLVMIISSIWQGIGLNLILFIVGLNNIPKEPIEAAKIEGASTIQLYTKVVIPLLKSTTTVVILMSLVNSFKVFDNIWVMTNGGPYRTSETLALTMYKETFANSKLGYGSAIAIMLTIVILFISFFYLKSTFNEKGGE
jgi:ABC-type sugar transport system permease subunit